jgi:hypothetical protein
MMTTIAAIVVEHFSGKYLTSGVLSPDSIVSATIAHFGIDYHPR